MFDWLKKFTCGASAIEGQFSDIVRLNKSKNGLEGRAPITPCSPAGSQFFDPRSVGYESFDSKPSISSFVSYEGSVSRSISESLGPDNVSRSCDAGPAAAAAFIRPRVCFSSSDSSNGLLSRPVGFDEADQVHVCTAGGNAPASYQQLADSFELYQEHDVSMFDRFFKAQKVPKCVVRVESIASDDTYYSYEKERKAPEQARKQATKKASAVIDDTDHGNGAIERGFDAATTTKIKSPSKDPSALSAASAAAIAPAATSTFVDDAEAEIISKPNLLSMIAKKIGRLSKTNPEAVIDYDQSKLTIGKFAEILADYDIEVESTEQLCELVKAAKCYEVRCSINKNICSGYKSLPSNVILGGKAKLKIDYVNLANSYFIARDSEGSVSICQPDWIAVGNVRAGEMSLLLGIDEMAESFEDYDFY